MSKQVIVTGNLNIRTKLVTASKCVIYTEDNEKFVLIEFTNNQQDPISGISYTLTQKDENGKVIDTSVVELFCGTAKSGESFGKRNPVKLRNDCASIEITHIKQLSKNKKKSQAQVIDSSNKFISYAQTSFLTIMVATALILLLFLPMYQQFIIWGGDVTATEGSFTYEQYSVSHSKLVRVDPQFDDDISLNTVNGQQGNANMVAAGAISGCNRVGRVNLYKMKNIEAGAIENCSRLQTIDIESKKIESRAIRNCPSLTDLYLEVKTIPESVAANCPYILTLYLYNVTTIEDYAFYDCTNISTVRIYGKKPKIKSTSFKDRGNISFFFEDSSINSDSLLG